MGRPALKQIAAGNKSVNLGVRDGPGQHPEPAVRVDVGNPFRATQEVSSRLDSTRNLTRFLDHGRLYVDQADAELELGIDVAEHLEVAVAGAGQLQDNVVRVHEIEELSEPFPIA